MRSRAERTKHTPWVNLMSHPNSIFRRSLEKRSWTWKLPRLAHSSWRTRHKSSSKISRWPRTSWCYREWRYILSGGCVVVNVVSMSWLIKTSSPYILVVETSSPYKMSSERTSLSLSPALHTTVPPSPRTLKGKDLWVLQLYVVSPPLPPSIPGPPSPLLTHDRRQ